MGNIKKYAESVMSADLPTTSVNSNNEYIESILKIINEISIIRKYNNHLAEILTLSIELVLDQSLRNQGCNDQSCNCKTTQQMQSQKMQLSEETKKEVDDIISEIGDL